MAKLVLRKEKGSYDTSDSLVIGWQLEGSEEGHRSDLSRIGQVWIPLYAIDDVIAAIKFATEENRSSEICLEV